MCPLDPQVPIETQLLSTATSVVLVNLFTVAEVDIPALMAAREKDTNWMKPQPGFISAQLHRATGGSCMFTNYAMWQSARCFRAAFTPPKFVSAGGTYPSSAVAQPHLSSTDQDEQARRVAAAIALAAPTAQALLVLDVISRSR